MEFDERIVPNELIVGISGNLCFFTYKDEKGKINRERSWSGWSENSENPLIVENKFMSGFKIDSINHRYSSNAKNQDNILIKHPLVNKCFEISLHSLVDILKNIL